jgi:parvulin-like peptidyl-prolyl isomerase
VAGNPITVTALEQELLRRGRLQPTPQEKTAVLEDLIRRELIYFQAQKDGYLQRPEVQDSLKYFIVARYRAERETNRSAPSQIPAADLQSYYQSHLDRFQVPPQSRVAMILLPLSAKAVPEKRAEAQQQAEAIRALAAAATGQDASFGMLARTNSAHQATRYRGGDLGWQTRAAAAQQWEPPLADAMFALQQPGEISPVVTGKDGLYLFKLMERKEATARPLAEVKDVIAHQLARERATQQEAAMFARLKAGVPIQVNEAVLQRVKPPAPTNPVPPSSPRSP